MQSDYSDAEDLRYIALLACIMVAEWEQELIEFPAGEPRVAETPYQKLTGCAASEQRKNPSSVSDLQAPVATGDDPAGVDYEAAATVWLLAQAGLTLPEVSAYMRGERSVS